MRIEIAETAGFCPGVRRAVEMVERAAKSGTPAVTYGPIIHNHHVVEHFEKMGVREISHCSEAQPGTRVIIRSHGVPKAIYEALEQRGAIIEDATCPYVKRIHRIVAEAERQGKICLIIGLRSHPEVEAIAGWCRDPHVFETAEEITQWLSEDKKRQNLPFIAVCQTTSTEKLWKNCRETIKKLCTNCEIFDTICSATEKRQSEAARLARQCEAMIVIGDRTSSNTKRLSEICSEVCSHTCLIDSGAELSAADFHGKSSVGITAGASTPEWIIKEVYNIMSDEIKNESMEESFDQLLEQYDKSLNTGDKVSGIVTGITPTEIAVDLGTKHAGYIPFSEVSDDPEVNPEEVFTVGEEIEVFVIRVNDAEGTVALSKKKLDAQKNWDEIEQAYEDKAVVEGFVTEQNKGGVVANVKGIRVFIPASQTGIPKNGDMGALVKTTVKLKITEVNRPRKRVVGSIRAVTAEARKAAAEKIWSEIEVGKKYHGVVKSLTSYGAFVDIGGVDGMVHVSELSWNRIKTPADVVAVGDEIEVYVISYDPEKRKISLGYKTEETNPWNIFMNNYHVGDVVTVKIVKLMTFGAFAEILPGIDGLIHISQIADRRIGKPEDVLSEGQTVEAKIIDVDAERKRISLSIRALIEEAPVQYEEDVPVDVEAVIKEEAEEVSASEAVPEAEAAPEAESAESQEEA